MLLLIFTNYLNIIDRVDDFAELFVCLVLFADFVFEFLLKNRILPGQIFNLILQILHLLLFVVEFILQMILPFFLIKLGLV